MRLQATIWYGKRAGSVQCIKPIFPYSAHHTGSLLAQSFSIYTTHYAAFIKECIISPNPFGTVLLAISGSYPCRLKMISCRESKKIKKYIYSFSEFLYKQNVQLFP